MKCFLAGVIFMASNVQQSEPSIRELRRYYQSAATEKKSAESLRKLVADADADSPATIVCYKGVSNMLSAKNGGNPLTKYRLFSSGKDFIAQAVNRDTLNIEARLLRFTMQYHAPAFLGYRSNLKADKLFLTRSLPKIKDSELKSMVDKMLSISSKGL